MLKPMGKSKSFGRSDGLNQKEKVEHGRQGKAARRTDVHKSRTEAVAHNTDTASRPSAERPRVT
jgi:hypothetical protein